MEKEGTERKSKENLITRKVFHYQVGPFKWQ